MELKTKLEAQPGRQDLTIRREFDLPVELLFRAYTEADLLSQWMGTNVVKLDNAPHGGYRFETADAQGNVVFKAHGAIHRVVANQEIIRTFEMENAPLPVQLEFLTFSTLPENRSVLTMQIVYQSAEAREQVLKMPFAKGINMAHNRLESIFGPKNAGS